MGWIHSKFSYKSGKWPEYKVGEEVYLVREIPKPWLGTGLSPVPTKYRIKEVSKTACGGIINREFVYVIVNTETNMVTINVYESELRSAAQPLGYYKPDHRHTDYEYLIIGVTKNLDRNEAPSFYNDNILELTYDSRTNTYSLWFDSTITDSAIVRSVTLLLMSLSLEGYSDDEVVRIQHKYIDATLKVGDDQIEAKDAWIAKSIYILVARRFIWDDIVCHDEKDEYIKTHPSAAKVYRPDKKYIKD
jgi:hypothetical protein